MDEARIRELLVELGAKPSTLENKGGWVMTSCLLAPWTHERGADSNPSFGVHIEDNDVSIFNCLTCKRKGPMHYLVELMEQYTGEDYGYLSENVDLEEAFLPTLPAWETTKRQRVIERPNVVQEAYVDLYDPAHGHPYLVDRGITDEGAVDRMGLRVDPSDSSGVERIMFPVRGPDGTLHGFSGRATNNRAVPKAKDYFGLDKRLLLLGAHLIAAESPYVILTEGLFDYANMVQLGQPAVAAMHSTLTLAQARMLIRWGKPVYVFYDNDKAGREGRQIVYELLHEHLPVMRVKYPKDAKDPGELYGDEVERMVRRAVLM